MHFLNLHLENFCAIRELDLPLANRGIVEITAENVAAEGFNNNGVGKSSVIGAIPWIIYGTTINKIDYLDDVVNAHAGKNCMGRLLLEKDGKTYEITRYRKHDIHKNKVYLTVDGIPVDLRNTREGDSVDSIILTLIGVSFDTFINAFFFGKGPISRVKHFSEMSDSEQADLLYDIIDFSRFDEALKRTKAKLAISVPNLATYKSKFVTINTLLVDTISTISKLEADKSQFNILKRAKIAALAEKLEKALNRIDEIEELLKGLSIPEKGGLEQELLNLRAKLASMTEADHRVRLQQREDTFLLEKRIEECRHSIETINKAKKKLFLRLEGVCDYCGSEIDTTTRDKRIAELDLECAEALTTKNSIENELIALELEHSQKNNEFKVEYDFFLQEEKVAVKRLSEIERQISEVTKEIYKQKSNLDLAVNEAHLISSQIEEAESSVYGSDASLLSLKEKKESLSKELQELDALVLDTERQLDILRFWEGAFSRSGVPRELFKAYIPILNKYIKQYLSLLVGGAITAEITADLKNKDGALKNKIKLQIINSSGAPCVGLNSTGELRRVNLAIMLALSNLLASRHGMSGSILCVDEAFDGMDPAGAARVLDLLRFLSSKYSSIFVVTHVNDYSAFFQNKIVLERTAVGTRIK